ncbi:MAG TPA: hypothetical protein VGT44_05120 [Ktedonobacteraceae bacterium]|nr:hypothetical protein [Ktedonobacteraceae bacterium]
MSTIESQTRDKIVFGLALVIAAEPSKLAQLRQALVLLRAQRYIPEDFSTWAIEQIDARVMSMALENVHDAELLLQILSFKGGSFDRLLCEIEELYRQEKISQRVYVKAKLLLRAARFDPNDPLHLARHTATE